MRFELYLILHIPSSFRGAEVERLEAGLRNELGREILEECQQCRIVGGSCRELGSPQHVLLYLLNPQACAPGVTALRETHVIGPGEVISCIAIGAVAGRLREGSRDDRVRRASNGDRAGIGSGKKHQVCGDGHCRSLYLSSPRA